MTQENKKCCPSCIVQLTYKSKNEFQCSNRNCPCHQQNQEKRTWRETEVLMQQAKENQECTCSSIGLNTPSDCPVHKNMWENQEKEFKKMLGEKAHITKEHSLHYSHYHCWDQTQPSACGIPLEKHTQCCLCDVQYARGTGGFRPENQGGAIFSTSDEHFQPLTEELKEKINHPSVKDSRKAKPILSESQESWEKLMRKWPCENVTARKALKDNFNMELPEVVSCGCTNCGNIKFTTNLLSSQKSSLVEEIEDNYERMLVDNPGDGKSYEAMVYNKGMEVFKKRVLALLKRD